ncbi:MAG: cytoskeletal protein CcmA (bactofilin family) [Granulosicoccus sp.]
MPAEIIFDTKLVAMFNSGSSNGNGTSGPSMPNHINSDTTIEGSIKSKGNLRIDGTLKGDLTCEGRVVVGKSGLIEGQIKCQNAEIEGQIKANIVVSELLTLKATAKLQGDIITKKLSIEPGANFTGSCSMGAVIKDITSSNAGQTIPQREKEAASA